VVQQFAVQTIGGVVTPAQALLVVVPLKSHLEVEAMVSNRDTGFVSPGDQGRYLQLHALWPAPRPRAQRLNPRQKLPRFADEYTLMSLKLLYNT
jgi:hypothetical protein